MTRQRLFLRCAAVCMMLAVGLLLVSSLWSATESRQSPRSGVRAIITGLSASERLQIEEYAKHPYLRTELRMHSDYHKKLPRNMHDKLSSEFSRLVSVKAMSSIDGAIELQIRGIADKGATLVITRIIGEALCRQVARLRMADLRKGLNALTVRSNGVLDDLRRECQNLAVVQRGISMESAEQGVVHVLQVVGQLERERERQELIAKRAKRADASSIVKGKPVPVAVALVLGEMPDNPQSDQEVQRLKARLEFKKALADTRLSDLQSEIKVAQSQLEAARTARKEAVKRRHQAREVELDIATLSARQSMLESKDIDLQLKCQRAKPSMIMLGIGTTTKLSADEPASRGKGK